MISIGGLMKKLLVAALVLISCAMFLSADVYITQKTHSDAVSFMGQNQPEKNGIAEMWLGKNKMANLSPEGGFILDLEKKVVLMINHQDKTYVQMDLPIDLSKYFPAQLLQMMGDVSVEVTATGQTEKIGSWNCTIYNMKMNMMMMTMNHKVWASTDVPFDWKNFMKDMYTQFAMVTMRLNEDAVKEMEKIQGFQIKSEITMDMMGTEMKSSQEVVEITEKTAPPGIYSAPEGYTKKDKFGMADFQNR
jgi:hypothetical protein